MNPRNRAQQRPLVILVAIALAACGSSKTAATTATTSASQSTTAGTPSTPVSQTTGSPGSSASTPTATAALSTTTATTASPGATSAPAACSLLKPSEVQAWLGGTVGPGKGDNTDCLFLNEAGKTVDVKSGWTVAQPKASVSAAEFTAEMKQYNGVAFSGAGDAAYLAQANSFVAFLKGKIEVLVIYGTSLIGTDDVTNLEGLAKIAAGRV